MCECVRARVCVCGEGVWGENIMPVKEACGYAAIGLILARREINYRGEEINNNGLKEK